MMISWRFGDGVKCISLCVVVILPIVISVLCDWSVFVPMFMLSTNCACLLYFEIPGFCSFCLIVY